MPLIAAAALAAALQASPQAAIASARPGDVLSRLSAPAGARLSLVDDAGGRVALRGREVVAGRAPLAAGPLAFTVRETGAGLQREARVTLRVSAPPKGSAGRFDRAALRPRPMFDEEFDAPPGSRWKSRFWFGDQAGDTSRTLGPINNSGNHEAEIYVDRAYKGLGIDPFSVEDGVLAIRADHTPPAALDRLSRIPFTSGLLTTEGSFAMTTGYVEVRALLPAGRGLWPAPLWLLPVPTHDAKGDPHVPGEQEIDGLEVLMHEPAKAFLTLHDPKGGQHVEMLSPDTASAWRTYGVLKTDTAITWVIDGAPVYTLSTPDDMKRLPMYLLIDLAVGGDKSWPGPPDGATRFPARLQIDYVRAYALK